VSERPSGVTVTGTGRVPVRPDVLVAHLGAEVVAGSVQDALDRCSAALAAITAALREWGVADADLGTSGASVYAAHDQHGNPRGWTASQQLTAKLRDIDRAGDLVSRAIAVGGDAARLHNLSFEVADDTAPRIEARRLAFADAKAKAELFAELAGRELGVVRAVAEGVGNGHVPGREFDAMLMAKSGSMPVEAGSLDVSVGVTVQWDFVG
jgi:uncharacterized protein YggE